MANRQYTFSLPPEASEIIDQLPKMEKSEHVAQALVYFKKEKAKQKALDVLAMLKPKDWATDRDAVELVQQARSVRAVQHTTDADE